MPVPLPRKSLRERAYNQAAVLGKELGRLVGTRVEEALIRVADTIRQVDLSTNARLTSMLGAFSSLYGPISGRKIVLSDDVSVTRTMLEECAVAQQDGNASCIWPTLLARER